tara:strand:- start:6927 stop:8156 length:1230 start_codon:yes stop_codon:yes gene_type:complete
MRVMAGESRLGEIHIATESEVTNNQFCNTILIRRRGRRERRIFYRYSEPDFPGTSNSQNYAVVAVLPYAMATGLDIRCFGPVDADLIEQLEECQDAWAMWRPDLFRVIRILPDTIAPSRLPTSRKAIIAFSGGLDSVYSLHAHKRGLLGHRELDIASAIQVHGFDLPVDQPSWCENAAGMARGILDAYGLPLTTVQTNWRDLEDPWNLSHIFGLAAVLHQFSAGFSHAIFSSDFSYLRGRFDWGSNPITNRLVSGPSFPIHVTGGNKSRAAKARAVINEPSVLNNLRVCWLRPESMGNCGRCKKCLLTKLSFAAAGLTHVPALGAPVTAEDILGFTFNEKQETEGFMEVLADWEGNSDLRSALAELLQRSDWKSAALSALPQPKLRGLPKIRHSLRKRNPFRNKNSNAN